MTTPREKALEEVQKIRAEFAEQSNFPDDIIGRMFKRIYDASNSAIAALTEPQPLEQGATEARILGYADSGGGIRWREDAGGYTGHLWSGPAESRPVVSREEAISEYRQDELDAVMYFVDKWFEANDPRLKDNPATRSGSAREIALRAIESQLLAPSAPSSSGHIDQAWEGVEFDRWWTKNKDRWPHSVKAAREAWFASVNHIRGAR